MITTTRYGMAFRSAVRSAFRSASTATMLAAAILGLSLLLTGCSKLPKPPLSLKKAAAKPQPTQPVLGAILDDEGQRMTACSNEARAC